MKRTSAFSVRAASPASTEIALTPAASAMYSATFLVLPDLEQYLICYTHKKTADKHSRLFAVKVNGS